MLSFGFAATAIALVDLPHSRPVILAAAAPLGGFMSTPCPVCVASAHDQMPTDRVVAVSGRLILISRPGSILGPLIGPSLMARLSIDGLFYFMAAVGLLLALLAVARRLLAAPPIHQERTFEIRHRKRRHSPMICSALQSGAAAQKNSSNTRRYDARKNHPQRSRPRDPIGVLRGGPSPKFNCSMDCGNLG
jgi:MFS family permease